MKFAVFLFCVFLLNQASGQQFCFPGFCVPGSCPSVDCAGPKVKDSCNCCDVCAPTAPSKKCGGLGNMFGNCAPDLLCLKDEDVSLLPRDVQEMLHGTCTKKYLDCAEACRDDSIKPSLTHLSRGKSAYILRKFSLLDKIVEKGFWTYCACEPGQEKAWTLVQRRVTGIVDFDVPWDKYVSGFGISKNDYWLGLEKLHELTRIGNHELMISVQYRGAEAANTTFGSFGVGPASTSYKLQLSKSDPQSSVAGLFVQTHNGMKFTVKDRDNDLWQAGNCAATLKGGWWHRSCTKQNLNGPLYGDRNPTMPQFPVVTPPPDMGVENVPQSMTWDRSPNWEIEMVEIKMRPVK